MSFSIKLGNFLYKRAFFIYKPLYAAFKNRQDAFEINLLKQHIRAGDVILDIGANIGFYANILSRLTGPNGHVHCFEPDTKNFAYLKSACGSLANCTLNNKAVGPKSEQIKIYTSHQLNVDHRTYKPEQYDQELTIDAVSIDDYLSTPVDFIKIDIQGFEMQAIRGMQKTLAANPQLRLISEFWPYGLQKAGSSVTEYYRFLTGLGFTCQLLKHNGLSPLTEARVKDMEGLGEAHYFNIFASRSHV